MKTQPNQSILKVKGLKCPITKKMQMICRNKNRIQAKLIPYKDNNKRKIANINKNCVIKNFTQTTKQKSIDLQFNNIKVVNKDLLTILLI